MKSPRIKEEHDERGKFHQWWAGHKLPLHHTKNVYETTSQIAYKFTTKCIQNLQPLHTKFACFCTHNSSCSYTMCIQSRTRKFGIVIQVLTCICYSCMITRRHPRDLQLTIFFHTTPSTRFTTPRCTFTTTRSTLPSALYDLIAELQLCNGCSSVYSWMYHYEMSAKPSSRKQMSDREKRKNWKNGFLWYPSPFL